MGLDDCCLVVAVLLLLSSLPQSTSLQVRISRSNIKVEHINLVQHSGSIKEFIVSALIECTTSCLDDDRCISYFYNNVSNRCVLHSKDFQYLLPNESEFGWKHFIMRDASGRCPVKYLYYRHLDFCYQTEDIYPIDFSHIKSQCSLDGGKLAAVDSQIRQDYFTSFLDGRPILRVCIGGNKQPNLSWRLDDGSPLNYFNWAPTDPDGGLLQLCLVMSTSDKWLDTYCVFNQSCIFVCEH